jgi:hypothetical protein
LAVGACGRRKAMADTGARGLMASWETRLEPPTALRRRVWGASAALVANSPFDPATVRIVRYPQRLRTGAGRGCAERRQATRPMGESILLFDSAAVRMAHTPTTRQDPS